MTTQNRHRLAVFIGRFQPFHIGHRAVLEHAATIADSALVLVGSAYRPRSPKNPLSFEERCGLMRAGLEGVDFDIALLPLVDTLYNDRAWASNVRTAVTMHMRAAGLDPAHTDILLTGYEKDSSSAYVRWFPEWRWETAPAHLHKGVPVSATGLRHALYDLTDVDGAALVEKFGARQVAAVQDWAAANAADMDELRAEAAYIAEYQARIRNAEDVYGYPIPINTADAIVVQSGHILLVERGQLPGKGLLALPGGHLDPGETALESAVRELYEECRIDVPKGVFHGRLRKRQVFDHPDRAERGWVRTEAFLFELEDRPKLEKVKAGDDAARAVWVPIADVMPDRLFEDHFDIIQTMVPEVPFAYSSLLMAHTA